MTNENIKKLDQVNEILQSIYSGCYEITFHAYKNGYRVCTDFEKLEKNEIPAVQVY